jgi:hypothetical protein
MEDNAELIPLKRGSFRALTDIRRPGHAISEGGSLSISNSEPVLRFSIHRAGDHDVSVSETYIASIIDDIQVSLRELDANPPLTLVEEWATLIHECLSAESRKFHSVHHVFEISAGCDPIQLLAAFFRDCIKRVTDGELVPRQEQYVADIFNRQGYIVDNQGQDRLIQMIMDIFELTNGQSLGKATELDVFLSAILMAKVLKETLNETILIQIVVCMEASIPFREQALMKLYQKLQLVNTKYDLKLNDQEIVVAVQRAADFSNRNLGNFSSEDAVFFLDHTWSLLPERSRELRRFHLYSVNDMLHACQGIAEFFETLNPDLVFQSFRGIPNEQEMHFFQTRLRNNLEKGRKYTRAQLLSVSICAAIATLSGGDGPMSFFTGDLPTHNYHSQRLGETFPTFDYKDITKGCDYDVYVILNRGRQQEQSFDTRNSPLAAYIYAILGDEGVCSALQFCHCPMTELSSKQLLQNLPEQSVRLVANDIGMIAVSRTEIIQNLMVELFENAREVS